MLSQFLQVIQDAKVWFLFVGIDRAGLDKASTPTPGFVIVNTDDYGDSEKHGARYEYQYERKKERKRDEITK